MTNTVLNNAAAENTVYVIAGPTGVGKTTVALALAKQLHTAIISADSRQCYRGMAIGTAQPTAKEQEEIKHYFINDCDITAEQNAGSYESLALHYVDEVFAKAPAAVVCGGTGLYIKALCEGLDDMPPTDPAIIKQTQAAYEAKGLAWLQDAVQTEDPAYYANGEIHNPSRLLRALSFIRSTGSSITAYQTSLKKERPFHIIKIGLQLPRPVLYERINTRVAAMMDNGLLDEAKLLYPLRHLKNLQTVGYAEMFDHIAGNCTLADAVEKIKQHTRNYAKRQMTWFAKDPGMNWFQADDPDIIAKILELGRSTISR